MKERGVVMNEIISLVSSVGFPIVACIYISFYVKTQTQNYREDIKELQKDHREEISQLSSVLENNTLAIQKLCDKLDNEKGEV